MKRIESSAELYDGINKILTKSSAICTNFFLSQDEVESAVEKRQLYVHLTDSGVLIYRRREIYCRTYFYLADPSNPSIGQPDFPAVLEIPFKERDIDAKKAIAGFAGAGFAPLFSRIRMTRRASEPDGETDGIMTAGSDQLAKLQGLFRENFHPYAGCVPAEDELACEIADGHILTDDKTSGLLHFTVSRTGTELRHLAVAENMRKCGIGGRLVHAYLSGWGEKKSTVWVRDDNEPAIRLYEKYGYKADGMKSAVLIYDKH